jgi:hypothetical protein
MGTSDLRKDKTLKEKQESLERLVNQYQQAKIDSNTTLVRQLEAILRRLGWTKFK